MSTKKLKNKYITEMLQKELTYDGRLVIMTNVRNVTIM